MLKELAYLEWLMKTGIEGRYDESLDENMIKLDSAVLARQAMDTKRETINHTSMRGQVLDVRL